jgi:O-antigen ligase
VNIPTAGTRDAAPEGLQAALRRWTPCWALHADWPALAAVGLIYSQFPDEWRVVDADVFIALTIVSLALRTVVLGERVDHLRAAAISAGLYWTVAAVSVSWAGDRARAVETLIRLGQDLVLFLVLAAAFSRQAALRRAAWMFVAVGALLTTGPLYQRVFGSYDNELAGFARVQYAHLWGDVNGYRAMGTLGDPNFFAQSLFPIVAISFGLLWGTRRAWSMAATFWVAAAALACVALTYSRGAVVALAVVLPLLVLTFRPRGRSALCVLLLLVTAAPFATEAYAHRLASFGKLAPSRQQEVLREPGFKGRTSEMIAGAQMFWDRPIHGVGVGNYEAHYRAYARRLGIDLRQEDREAHSLPLEIASELGLLGIAAFSLLLGTVLNRLYRVRAMNQTTVDAAITTGIAVALAGYYTTSLFLHDAYQRQLWIVMAMAYATWQAANTTGHAQPTSSR